MNRTIATDQKRSNGNLTRMDGTLATFEQNQMCHRIHCMFCWTRAVLLLMAHFHYSIIARIVSIVPKDYLKCLGQPGQLYGNMLKVPDMLS